MQAAGYVGAQGHPIAADLVALAKSKGLNWGIIHAARAGEPVAFQQVSEDGKDVEWAVIGETAEQAKDTITLAAHPSIRNRKKKASTVKLAKVPAEIWRPVRQKLEGNKEAVKKLIAIIRSGDTEALMGFARDTGIDYDALRAVMNAANPDHHTSKVLGDALKKAVRALKDSGTVAPVKVDKDMLWKAWTRAVDDEAQ